VISFPNAKINLGLHIKKKRSDGYHDLETLYYPIAYYDILEIVEAKSFHLSFSGIAIPGDAEGNLCAQAYQLLKTKFPALPGLKTYLHKNIPTGAGLGGGSSDGAFMLHLVNKKFKLGLNDNILGELTLKLGSDCPFFILNKPSLGLGRGEILKPVPLDLSQYSFVLINSGLNISTKWAFSKITPMNREKSVQQIISQPITSWKKELLNDFEPPVFQLYPALAMIKEKLYQSGALYASMTGSGSSLFGIFDRENDGRKKFLKDQPGSLELPAWSR